MRVDLHLHDTCVAGRLHLAMLTVTESSTMRVSLVASTSTREGPMEEWLVAGMGRGGCRWASERHG
jgi:hypothetical protein